MNYTSLLIVFFALIVFTSPISGSIGYEKDVWLLNEKTAIDKCIDTKISKDRDQKHSLTLKLNDKAKSLSKSEKNYFKDYPIEIYRKHTVVDEKDPTNFTVTLKLLETRKVSISKDKDTSISLNKYKDMNSLVMKIGENSISYSGASHVITLIGEGAGNDGGDWSHAYNWMDIWEADQANGWNILDKIGDGTQTFYLTGATIYLGDVNHDTYFLDAGKTVIVMNLPEEQYFFDSYPDRAYVQFGHVKNIADKTTQNGMIYNFNFYPFAPMGAFFCRNLKEMYIYGCTIRGLSQSTFGYNFNNTNGRIWDTRFLEGWLLQRMNAELDVNNIVVTACYSPFYFTETGNATFNRIEAYNVHIGLSFCGLTDNVTVRNPIIRDMYRAFQLARSNGYDVFIIDAVLDWDKPVNFHQTGTSQVFRQYTFNLITTPESNITITNPYGFDYEGISDENGTITEQILTSGTYNSTKIFDSHNPYTVTISKEGHESYYQTINVTEPFDCEINLIPIPVCTMWECQPLSVIVLVIGLIFIAFYFQSPVLCLITGLFLIKVALRIIHDTPDALGLLGFAVIMFAASIVIYNKKEL